MNARIPSRRVGQPLGNFEIDVLDNSYYAVVFQQYYKTFMSFPNDICVTAKGNTLTARERSQSDEGIALRQIANI